MKTVKVIFTNAASIYHAAKQYHYLCPYDGVQVGQHAVVDTPHNGYALVKVEAVEDGSSIKATKEIVQLIDDGSYKQRQENEEKRKALIKQLEALDKKEREKDKFSWLADRNPEAKALIEQLRSL